MNLFRREDGRIVAEKKLYLHINFTPMYRIALILALSLFAASCGGRRSRPQQTACVPQPRVFLPAIAPARLSPQEQRDYLRWHYWDRFDFADTLFVREADTVQMV